MNNLEQRVLGRTGLSVTTLGYGAMDLGGPPAADEMSDEDAGKVLNAVLDYGINYINTAVCYGTSEARIGRYISHRRDEYFLASKHGCIPGAPMGVGPHDYSAANVRAGVEHSLRTMRTEYLDVAQFHHSVSRKEWESEGALEELLKMKEEGKLRFIAVSGFLPNLVEQVDSDLFDVFQIPYSALQQEHEEIITKASKKGAGIVIRGGVARGAPVDWNKRYSMVPPEELSGRWNRARLDELLNGMSRIEFMVRFVLSEPTLDTTIIGTKNLDHLRENVEAALKGGLPQDLVVEAKRRLNSAGSKTA